jgi:S-sulfosulfanyl-L-cysteine sulfohydrolase
VTPQKGKPVWEVVADYLRDKHHPTGREASGVRLKGVDDNPGFASLA